MPINELERLELVRKKRTVFEMRMKRIPFRTIADELQISINTVQAYFREMLQLNIPEETLDEMRSMDIEGYNESERLTLHMIHVVTQEIDKRIQEGESPLAAQLELLTKFNDQLVTIRKARAMLTGMNRPVQVNHNLTVRTTMDEEVEALTSEVLGGGNVMSLPDDVLIEE